METQVLCHTSELKFVESAMLFKAKVKIADDELEKRGILEVTKRVYTFNVSAKDLFVVISAGEKQEELFGDANLTRNAIIVKAENNIDENSSLEDIVLNSKHYSLVQSILLPFCNDRRSNLCMSSIYLPESGKYVIIIKSLPDEAMPIDPAQRNFVKMRLYVWTIIEPIDDCKCRKIIVIGADISGNLKYSNHSISKWMSTKIGIRLLKDLMKKYDKVLAWYVDEKNREEVRDDTKTLELTALNEPIAKLVEKLL
jgi:hypothetical protein